MPLFPIIRDPATTPFLDGCERGELLIVRDRSTGRHHEPDVDVTADPDRLSFVPARGTGTVVSWSVHHGRGPGGEPTRLLFGIVELTEGPWIWAELRSDRPVETLTGADARVGFARSGPEPEHASVPYFTVD